MAWNALVDHVDQGKDPKFKLREKVTQPWKEEGVYGGMTDPEWEDRTEFLSNDTKMPGLVFGEDTEIPWDKI